MTNPLLHEHVGDELLTPAEVAALFRVDPKTVSRWATRGQIDSIRTPGRHRRFWASSVYALLEEVHRDDAVQDSRG